MHKPTLGVYKFTSCDGCQLAFLNAGETLLQLAELVDIVHFPEAGPVNPHQQVDIAFVEGSVSTPDEEHIVKTIRTNAKFLITIGACATAGGLQALRNFADVKQWVASIYTDPQHINTLSTSTAISQHVKVDLELWGCPVNTAQVMSAIRSLLFSAKPFVKTDSVCLECKRQNNVCVMVAHGEPCMGPVTKTGCGAICPSANRGCYACYGPAENPNTQALSNQLQGFGLLDDDIQRLFQHINSQAPAFIDSNTKSARKPHD